MKRILPESLEKHLIAVLLAAIVLIMLIEAACRHLWPEVQVYPLKVAGGCLAWMASLGMSRAASLGAHIRVSFVEMYVNDQNRRRLSRIADIAFFIFTVVSLVVGCLVLYRSLVRENIPSHPIVYAAIPAGSILTMIRLVERLRAPSGGTGQ